MARLLCSGLLLVTSSVAAGAQQSHTSILEAVRTFLQTQAEQQFSGRVETRLSPLDKRLKLAACASSLDVSLAPGAKLIGTTSARVSCPRDTTSWSIYVTGKISVFGYTLVSRRALARGTLVTAADLQLVEQDLSRLYYGYLSDPQRAQGKELTRAVPAGQVLTPSLLRAPLVVRRGDRVTLQARIGGLDVSMQGEALSDGAQGQRLRVRALNSKRVVEGQLISANVVKVTL